VLSQISLFEAFFSAISDTSAVNDYVLCGFLVSFQVRIAGALAEGAFNAPLLGREIF
jgi:hypothetical protein